MTRHLHTQEAIKTKIGPLEEEFDCVECEGGTLQTVPEGFQCKQCGMLYFDVPNKK